MTPNDKSPPVCISIECAELLLRRADRVFSPLSDDVATELRAAIDKARAGEEASPLSKYDNCLNRLCQGNE